MTAPILAAQGLSKCFGSRKVIDGVELNASRGEIVGIVGPGGAGKTVLLKLLAGLITPDEGTVHAFGNDFAGLDADQRAAVWERFGVLFQNYALFDFMTVGENIGFPLEQRRRGDEVGKGAAAAARSAEIASRVAVRLREVDLPGTQHLYPNELSGGMKKRVALARATIADADVLLYDDPTAGLDPVTSSKIFALIERLHPVRTGITVVVSHDIDRMLPVCQRFILLDKGRIRFEGDRAAADRSTDKMVRTFFDSSARLSGSDKTPIGVHRQFSSIELLSLKGGRCSPPSSLEYAPSGAQSKQGGGLRRKLRGVRSISILSDPLSEPTADEPTADEPTADEPTAASRVSR